MTAERRTRPVALPVARGDERPMASLLADAFFDDPLVSWLYPADDQRRGRFRRLMAALLATTRQRSRCLTTDDHGGCALWLPPGQVALTVPDLARMTPAATTTFRGRLPRILTLFQHVDHQHPREPHWYLFVVGSDPGRRGQGHGRAVIESVLADADSSRTPAYLESSNPENVGYYERLGFGATGELSRAGSPPLIPMWRPVGG